VAVIEGYVSIWGGKPPRSTKTNALKAIKENCLLCNGLKYMDEHGKLTTERWTEDKDCTDTTCPHYPFRPGDGGFRVKKRKLSGKQLESAQKKALAMRTVRKNGAKTP